MIRYIHLKDTYVILEVFKMRVDNDEMYVCRCEEITKAEVIEAVSI